MEGYVETRSGAPALVAGWPDAEAGEMRNAIGIPDLASLNLIHDLNGTVRGLKDMPRETWATNLRLVFWSFRIMVGPGLLMIALGLATLWLRWPGRLYETVWFHHTPVALGPSGLIVVTAGWIATETERQPFVIDGVLRTADSVSPVAAPAVATSLAAFAAVCLAVFGTGIWYWLHLFDQTPHVHESGPPTGVPVRTAGITPAPALDAPHDGGSRPALQPANRAAHGGDLGRGHAPEQPALPARRNGRAPADGPRLYRLRLLAVPGEGHHQRARLSLRNRVMTIPDPVRRIGWFVTLWAGGIAGGLTVVDLPL